MKKVIQKCEETLHDQTDSTERLEEKFLSFGFDHSVEEFSDFLIDPFLLPKRPSLYQGVKNRLVSLGDVSEDASRKTVTDCLLSRYRKNLGILTPRAVKNWMKGTPPGTEKSRNHYELTMALECDLKETEQFFLTYFLMEPFCSKSSLDAVFFFSLKNHLSYPETVALLEEAEGFSPEHLQDFNTAELLEIMGSIGDREEFLTFLKQHTYQREERHMRARNLIRSLIRDLLPYALKPNCASLYEMLMGFGYQKRRVLEGHVRSHDLPKEVTYCFPTDRTLLDLLKDETEAKALSYETLRKTLIILNFFDSFRETPVEPEPTVTESLFWDFRAETDELLFSVGFGKLYLRNPFDYLILYCAAHENPVEAWHAFNMQRFL